MNSSEHTTTHLNTPYLLHSSVHKFESEGVRHRKRKAERITNKSRGFIPLLCLFQQGIEEVGRSEQAASIRITSFVEFIQLLNSRKHNISENV
jgi:hypothetical protein